MGNLLDVTQEYRKSVQQELVSLKSEIRSVNDGKDPDLIILSGGASTMKWFRNAVSEVFECNQILNRYPDFIVAKGAALYGKAQMHAWSKRMKQNR